MILTKSLKISINNRNIEHYNSLGYNVKYFDVIDVPIKDLRPSCNNEVLVVCDNCGAEKYYRYQEYNKSLKTYNVYYCKLCAHLKNKRTCLERYGVENASSLETTKKKREETNLKNFGCVNVFQNEDIKKKLIETMLLKYNVTNPNKSDVILKKRKETRILNNKQIPDELLSEYQLYCKKARNETEKYKNDLINNWNGFDYYDKEYIKENFNLNSNDLLYPNIDHKISIFYGFVNNIDYKIIGNIDNLCITKKKHNASKNKLTELEYKNKLENKNDN